METPWNKTLYSVSGTDKTPLVQTVDLTWGSGESGYLTATPSSAQTTFDSSTYDDHSITPSTSVSSCDNYSSHKQYHAATPRLRGAGRVKRTTSFTDVLNLPNVEEKYSNISESNLGPSPYQYRKEFKHVPTDNCTGIFNTSSDDEFSDVFDRNTSPKTFQMNYYRPRSECTEAELNSSPRLNFHSSATHTVTSNSVCVPPSIPEHEEVNHGTSSNNIEAEFVQKFNESQHLITWNKSSSCPVTPTKNKSPLKRRLCSPERGYSPSNSETTPDKLELYSPILKRESSKQEPLKRSASFSHTNRQSTIKRLNFGAKHEKNKILYSSLPTTPEKGKSPEKIGRKRISKPHAKRSLLINYSGRDRLDLLYVLGVKSDYSPVVTKIFSYLSDEDLCRVSLVSKIWRTLCIRHSTANTRRLKYVNEKRIFKENIFENNLEIKNDEARAPTESRKVLFELQNKTNTVDTLAVVSVSSNNIGSLSPRSKRFRNYLQASQGLEPHKRLKMCPKCSEPSQPLKESDDEFRCTSMSCSYFFCSRCMCPAHTGYHCIQNGLGAQSPPRPGCRRPVRVGTQQSKRNLRRL